MWQAIFLTIVATAGNNVGKVLQKKGTQFLPPFSLKLKVISAYMTNKTWITGFMIDIAGAVLMLSALSQAPVSIIQPVSGSGLAILCVFSHFYLKEIMDPLDWVGITLAGFGTIGVGIGGEEQELSNISLFSLPWLVFVVAILFVLLNGWLHIRKRQRRDEELGHSDVLEEIIFGLEAGILFGMASVISKMGFIFTEQGFSRIFIPLCISVSVCCSAIGFVYQTRGLKHGRAIVVSTCAAVASILTGVLAGMLALGEKLPSGSLARTVLLVGWLLIIVGVVLLVCSRRLRSLLPRSLRRRLPTGATERNASFRKSGSVHGWEPNPVSLVPTNPLLHLKASPAKAKP
ncbi:probable magnesium transporter NIPA9 isoform X1 [Nymphaea colorata]|nr:probable magnesium transporter NIPA9 isoform X1 [Nymphaea colorata]